MNPTDVRPFIQTGNTITISATGTSSSTAISASRPAVSELPGTMKIYNSGAVVVFIRQGATAPTATSADTPIAPGNTETIQMLGDTAFIGCITASSTATVYVTPGQGS